MEHIIAFIIFKKFLVQKGITFLWPEFNMPIYRTRNVGKRVLDLSYFNYWLSMGLPSLEQNCFVAVDWEWFLALILLGFILGGVTTYLFVCYYYILSSKLKWRCFLWLVNRSYVSSSQDGGEVYKTHKAFVVWEIDIAASFCLLHFHIILILVLLKIFTRLPEFVTGD